MKLKILLLGIFFMFSVSLRAQTIFLDTTFNAGGTLKGKKVFNNLNGSASAMAVDGQGKIYIAASSMYGDSTYVIRLKPDGTTDAPSGKDTIALLTGLDSFGNPIYATINCLVLQPDGKILLAGSMSNPNDGADMMVGRLNADGSRDKSFGVNGFWIKQRVSYVNDYITNISLQSDGKIIVAATVYDYTISPTNRMAVFRLTANGTVDSGFNNYTSAVTNSYPVYTTGLDLYKDTIIVGGNFIDDSGIPYYTIVKLTPKGVPYTGGRWSKGIMNFYPGSGINQNEGDLAVRSDGYIFIGGNYGTSAFKFIRVSPNGMDTSTMNVGSVGGNLTDVLIDSDGKIILSGHNSARSYIAVKVDEFGNYDSTFAVNGQFIINTVGAKSYQSAFSRDHKLLLVGEEIPGQVSNPSILKIYIKPPIYILGSDYVLPNSSETYRLLTPPGLTNFNYSYTWSIPSGQNVLLFPVNANYPKIATLFFGGSATKIRLTCTASPPVGANGGAIMKVEKDILVNTSPTSAKDLDSVKCAASVTSCSTGYIDYFKLNLIRNDSSGCSSSGYSDYTQSSMIDTLVVGGVYSATLRVDEPKVYVGIWIDYNNDGVFNTSDEFVAEVFSNNTFIQMNNIILKNEEGYFGPKRMRVRCRANTPFNPTESCPVEGEGGETEDYLVVLIQQDELAAPQIITPNDDGKNDYFVVRGVDPDSKNKLTIFDRWGKVKFSTENYENNWNGTAANGDKLLPGTYYYLFTHNDELIRGFLEVRY